MMRKFAGTRRLRRGVGALFLALALVAPIGPREADAAVPKLSDIRVALYLLNGGYNVTTPSVTLSSAQGLDIGLRSPEGSPRAWTGTEAGVPARFAVDAYQVLALETTEREAAKLVAQALNATADKPTVVRHASQSQTVYRVYAGSYATKEEANTAAQRISANAAIASRLKGMAAATGPYRWNAGTMPSEGDAERQAAALRSVGLHAEAVVTEGQGGAIAFQVWVGEETDAERLEVIRQRAAQASPGLPLEAVQGDRPYLVKQDDATAELLFGGARATRYSFNARSQLVWVTPRDGVATVAEKNGRSYRGGFELRQHNGKLAVINELPFEQYLVSVVGAEMSPPWPVEALKAQAVAARTFALNRGAKYEIAHVSDSSNDQVYYGVEKEDERVATAVQATAGEVLLANGELIEPYYFSNGGGMTGDPIEVWGQPIPYVKATISPDEGPKTGKLNWYQVATPQGKVGYVREDLVNVSSTTNSAGLTVVTVKSNGTNIRPAPYVDDTRNKAIAAVNQGDKLSVLGRTPESNDYAWFRGPYRAADLLNELNRSLTKPISGPLERFEVGKRGASGRAVELAANGQTIALPKADQLRGLLFNAPSIRFEIEETGRYTVLGAAGVVRSLPETKGTLHVIGGSAQTPSPLTQSDWIVLGHGQQTRAVTKEPMFMLRGSGNGHGLGMSQWGAKSLAESGQDYQAILRHYYTGVTIVKD